MRKKIDMRRGLNRGMTRGLRLAASVSALSLVLGAAPAFAQSAAEKAPADEASTTQDIVVTAQRREEKLSKVPVSVVAFSAETLRSKNITSEQDVGTLVPGLQVKNGQNSNQLSFSLRGQTLDPFSGTSPAVLTYLNEAPYNPGNTATAFFDLGSIQVLKGPQGTLFGRNATGGAVLYSTPMPGDTFSGYLIARGASRDYGQIQAAVDLPLAPGKLAVRLAFDATRGNGYITNINTGNTLGDKNSRSGRATILFTPTDTIKNVTIVQYDNVKGTEGAGGIWTYNSVPSCTPGPCTPAQLAAGDFTQYNSNGTTHTITHSPGTVAAPLTNTLALLYGNLFKNNNGPAAPGVFPGGVEGYTAFSHANPYKVWLEYDLPHRAENFFTYTAGLFLSSSHRNEEIPINIGNDLGLPGPVADIAYDYRNRELSKAVFGQVSYKITDQLTATLGGRYTWVTVGITQNAGNVFGVDPASAAATQENKLSAPAWNASLNYQIDNNNMVYFSQRGSFRSGNLNGTVAPSVDPLTGNAANSFKNEYVHDFEVGYKFNGRIGGAPAQFNIAAYDVIVKNGQHALYAVIGGNPAGFTVNVPEAITKGVEVDAAIGLTDWLNVGFNFAYTDAKYTKGTVPIPFVGTLPVDSYPDSPKWSGSANIDVKLPVPANIGTMDLRTDFYGQTHTFFSSTNGTSTPGTRLEGYSTVGMRLSWKEIMQSPVSAALYVRNLGDRKYYIAGYALGASSGLNTAYPGEPRTIGAELSVKF